MNTAVLDAQSTRTTGEMLTTELLQRFDIPGPRYTSYPTADRFIEAFGPADYRTALRGRVDGAARRRGSAALSLYVHIPFCESVCYYCACNKVVTKQHDRATRYLEALEMEIALHVAELGSQQPVMQLHLGGGSPTFLDDAELTRVMQALRSSFQLQPQAEVSIEVDPRTVSRQRLEHLAALGFNRLSFGVQDFDPDVQVAVHREQSLESVQGLLRDARELGFQSTNVDLIYGLPRQTAESMTRTLDQVCELRPDRIALYAYAHLPQRFKPQRRIEVEFLPSAVQKVGMLSQAIARFTRQGYDYIGMDHFALPDDALAAAKRQGRLHRNFQGYSTQPDRDLVALGVSAIGHVGASYSQNAKTLDEYYDALAAGEFPIVRGLKLSRADVLRRSVIMALMCQGRVEFDAIEEAHLVNFRSEFAAELHALQPLQGNGLVRVDERSIEVTSLGWYFVRLIAMQFDQHLQADRARDRFSRIL